VTDQPNNSPSSARELVARVAGGDVRAIARAISLVEERGRLGEELLTALSQQRPNQAGRCVVVGITGAAGSGKSTLTDALIGELRKENLSVGVLAVDPSSAATGGALLGDRIRMQSHGLDPGVLIRSMATRGALGGVARATRDAVSVLEASGRDWIIIETVGVGQDEIAVAQLADVTVLVLTPGAGDDVQTMKAGIMEIADIFVLNKADDPAVARLEANVRESLALREAAAEQPEETSPPVIKTVATEGRGVPQLKIAIAASAAAMQHRPSRQVNQAPLVQLDHLGIAVPELDAALKFYEGLLGLQLSGTYEIPQERTRVGMLPAGDARIELLEPSEPDSPIGRFLAKRGPGLHHICLRVPDLAEAIARLKQAGTRLISETPQTGAGGHSYVFVHPSGAGGVLLELVQAEANH
jgi:LAO/AO transport system kinase